MNALAPSRTPTVLIIGRTLVDGPEDVANVHALQAHYQLTPLSLWGQPGAQVLQDRTVLQPWDPKTDPLATWKTMNRAMTEEPPEARHAALLKLFATIGVGPNQQVERLDEASQRGLARAAEEGPKFLAAVFSQGGSSKRANGWLYVPTTMGRAGLHDDFVTRAAIQCAADIITHEPEEVVYRSLVSQFAPSLL